MIDVIVVGAEPVGTLAALPTAELGDRTVHVSSGEFGGMATNGSRPRSSRLGLLYPRRLRALVTSADASIGQWIQACSSHTELLSFVRTRRPDVLELAVSRSKARDAVS